MHISSNSNVSMLRFIKNFLGEVITPVYTAVVVRVITIVTLLSTVRCPGLLHRTRLARGAAVVQDGLGDLLDVLVDGDLAVAVAVVLDLDGGGRQPLGGVGQVDGADVESLLGPPAQVDLLIGWGESAGEGWQGPGVPASVSPVQSGGASPPASSGGEGASSPGGGQSGGH